MASRYYKVNGVDVPSVTTITGQLDKPALVAWAANAACDYVLQQGEQLTQAETPDQPAGRIILFEDLRAVVQSARTNFREVSRHAMDLGSRIHDAVEQFLKTGREPFKPADEVLSGFLAFLEWKDGNRLEVISTEKTVYGERYAGTCDLICRLNGRKYLIDYKSSSGIYPEMRYQVAAYRQTDETIEGCGILRLDKKTGYPEWKDTSDTYEEDRAVFNLLRDLWWKMHPLKSRQFNIRRKAAA